MKSLLAILAFLSQQGIGINDFDIETHYSGVPSSEVHGFYDAPTDRVYDCDAWVDDATILVCPSIRKIIISK